jgi:16S rRNA (uracil1498-N3)-methyltransferase
MNLFYAPDITENQTLPEEEAIHALKVLRLKKGEQIDITDGKGFLYKALITEIIGKKCQFEILDFKEQEPLWKGKIEVAVAPTKNLERIEWFVEKAVEIGIDNITFLSCRYSERKEIKLERIKKIAISAMKQSLKARLPEISNLIDYKTFINTSFDGRKYIAHCYEGNKNLLQKEYKKEGNVRVLIGPEGDFSEEEVSLAVDRGYIPVSLCESRLRTETAALFACQTIHIVNS